MGTIKYRNGMDLTEEDIKRIFKERQEYTEEYLKEDIKKRQEYTEELYKKKKKILMTSTTTMVWLLT